MAPGQTAGQPRAVVTSAPAKPLAPTEQQAMRHRRLRASCKHRVRLHPSVGWANWALSRHLQNPMPRCAGTLCTTATHSSPPSFGLRHCSRPSTSASLRPGFDFIRSSCASGRSRTLGGASVVEPHDCCSVGFWIEVLPLRSTAFRSTSSFSVARQPRRHDAPLLTDGLPPPARPVAA